MFPVQAVVPSVLGMLTPIMRAARLQQLRWRKRFVQAPRDERAVIGDENFSEWHGRAVGWHRFKQNALWRAVKEWDALATFAPVHAQPWWRAWGQEFILGPGHAVLNVLAVPSVLPDKKSPAAILRQALKAGRAILYAPSADVFEAALRQEARNDKLPLPFLRLTLREQSDLDRLMRTVSVQNGELTSREGTLVNLIRHGGILLIDYNASDPKLVEGFNSLFDNPPRFGAIPVSKALRIIGTIDEAHVLEHPTSFYDRFQFEADFEMDYEDKLASVTAPPSHFSGAEINLYDSTDFREMLLGGFALDSRGRPLFIEGALPKAIRAHQSLLIRGGAWDDVSDAKTTLRDQSPLAQFVRQMLLEGTVEINGVPTPLPADFKLYRAPADYEAGVQHKRLLAVGESFTDSGELWVLNSETQDLLFSQTHITADGRLTQRPGLLNHSTLRVRVTEPLADWVWHRLMHSLNNVDVEVLPGVQVPAAYRGLRSEAQKSATKASSQLQPWSQMADSKAIYVESSDSRFAETLIREHFAKRVVWTYPATPETTLSQLVASIEMGPSSKGDKHFRLEKHGLLSALERGDVIILEGLESNPVLRRELETVLTEQPYLTVQGEVSSTSHGAATGRISLEHLPGQLVLLSQPVPGTPVHPTHAATITPDNDALMRILAKEFPSRFNRKDFQKICELQQLFETIPAPTIDGLYPEKLDFGLSRLRLLYRYDDWMEAFEQVVISNYVDHPEVAAFMRTMVRLKMNVEEPGRKRGEILGRRLTRAMNKAVGPKGWEQFPWQFADTLSLQDLKKAALGSDFARPQSAGVLRLIREALIAGSSGERQEYYETKFSLKKESIRNPSRIDWQSRVGEPTWNEKKKQILKALKIARAVMIKGAPGTGKSFVTEDIARELGYRSEEIFGPLTIGSDVRESDIVSRRTLRNDATAIENGAIAAWASRKDGGLLIVDEANLADPHFWNFLKGVFADKPYVWTPAETPGGVQEFHWLNAQRHRIIFTGNQETLVGRRFQQLIQKEVITERFGAFDREFIGARIDEYLASTKARRPELVSLINELDGLFNRVAPEAGFSLRDVQELAARENVFLGSDWTPEEVVYIAWRQYNGNFTPETRLALEFYIANKYGVVVRDLEKKAIEKVQQTRALHYTTRLQGKPAIALVPSTAEMILDVDDYVRMRDARLHGKTGLPGKGKRGLVFEGPSGRGKDLVVARALEEPRPSLSGKSVRYQNATEADAQFPREQVYYHPNASLNYQEVQDVLEHARRENSVPLISEMNLLPSGLLEGKLNAEGNTFLGTINSANFQGRERLSTALLNRIVYRRVPEYTQAELLEIAQVASAQNPVSKADLQYLARLHGWIANEVPNAIYRPTPRVLLRAVRWRSENLKAPLRDVLDEIYGPLYLRKFLKGRFPTDQQINEFKEPSAVDNIKMIERLFTLVGDEAGGPITVQLHRAPDSQTNRGRAAGFWDSTRRLFSLEESAFRSGDWEETLLHEASHSQWTRKQNLPIPDELRPLYDDLEDVRHLNATASLFPSSHVNVPSKMELSFAGAVRRQDAEELLWWLHGGFNAGSMSLQQLFQYSLAVFARDLVTRPDIEGMADLFEGLLTVNPFRLALPCLDIAKEVAHSWSPSMDEDEKEFQQYRAVKRILQMGEFFREIPEDVAEELPPIDNAERQEKLQAALKDLQSVILEANKPQVEKHNDLNPRLPALMSTEDAKAKREKLKLDLEKRVAALREHVIKELDQIQEDLSAEEGLTQERLDEIRAELSNPAHPAKLLQHLRQLKDSMLDLRAANLRKQAQETSAFATWGSVSSVSSDEEMDKAFSEIMGNLKRQLSGGSHRGPRKAPIGVRHGGAASHDHDMTKNLVTLAISKKEPVRAEMHLSVQEGATRDPQMAAVSQAHTTELDQALAEFVQRNLEASKVPGSKGALNVHRFLSGGDPNTIFDSTGGQAQTSRKEIVLRSRPGDESVRNSPILRELLFYLTQKGFRFTVYTSPHTFVDGLSTVSDLERAFRSVEGPVQDADIVADFSKRKPGSPYQMTTLAALQERAEPVILHGAFQSVLREYPTGVPPAPTQDALQQMEDVYEAFDRLGIDRKLLLLNEDGKTFKLLGLEPVKEHALPPLPAITRLWITDERPMSANLFRYLQDLKVSAWLGRESIFWDSLDPKALGSVETLETDIQHLPYLSVLEKFTNLKMLHTPKPNHWDLYVDEILRLCPQLRIQWTNGDPKIVTRDSHPVSRIDRASDQSVIENQGYQALDEGGDLVLLADKQNTWLLGSLPPLRSLYRIDARGGEISHRPDLKDVRFQERVLELQVTPEQFMAGEESFYKLVLTHPNTVFSVSVGNPQHPDHFEINRVEAFEWMTASPKNLQEEKRYLQAYVHVLGLGEAAVRQDRSSGLLTLDLRGLDRDYERLLAPLRFVKSLSTIIWSFPDVDISPLDGLQNLKTLVCLSPGGFQMSKPLQNVPTLRTIGYTGDLTATLELVKEISAASKIAVIPARPLLASLEADGLRPSRDGPLTIQQEMEMLREFALQHPGEVGVVGSANELTLTILQGLPLSTLAQLPSLSHLTRLDLMVVDSHSGPMPKLPIFKSVRDLYIRPLEGMPDAAAYEWYRAFPWESFEGVQHLEFAAHQLGKMSALRSLTDLNEVQLFAAFPDARKYAQEIIRYSPQVKVLSGKNEWSLKDFPEGTFSGRTPKAVGSTASSGIQWLQTLVDALINRAGALAKLEARFRAEGQEKEFQTLLAQVQGASGFSSANPRAPSPAIASNRFPAKTLWQRLADALRREWHSFRWAFHSGRSSRLLPASA